jgi:CspA family cold shock protein
MEVALSEPTTIANPTRDPRIPISSVALPVKEVSTLDQTEVAMHERVHGVVKWFNPRKGYGFITRPGKPDIFVHYSQITADGFRLLEDGQEVEFTLADGEKGLHAQDVVAVKSL